MHFFELNPGEVASGEFTFSDRTVLEVKETNANIHFTKFEIMECDACPDGKIYSFFLILDYLHC